MQKISAFVLAYNEAEKIKAAVETVLWADEIDHGKEHSRRLPRDRMRLKASVRRCPDPADLRPVVEALDQGHRRHNAQKKNEVFGP